MPITLEEKFQSRPATGGENAQTDLIFVLRGSDDEIALKAALVAGTSPWYDGLKRKTWHVEQVGNGLWEGTVRYSPPDSSTPEDVGSVSLSIDTTGGTMHITQSIVTVAKRGILVAGDEKTPPDFKGAIGVTHDNVEGVDIIVPVFKFTATKVFALAGLPSLLSLYQLTGKVNTGAFTVTDTTTGLSIVLADGECLFNGAKVNEPREDGNVEISYDFAANPNATLSIAGFAPIAKKGWEYLWVRYADAVDEGAKAIVKRPIAAYVEKVYEQAAFTGLGL